MDDATDDQGGAPVDDATDDQGDAPVDDATNNQGETPVDNTADAQDMIPHDPTFSESRAESNSDGNDAFSKISDYMNTHNYGPDDFATYSQDPEWRALQQQAFPDYELPPLSQESAFNQLSEYMNTHNYGPDDFSVYSQDPKWRELQSAAFPDYELPPMNDSTDTFEINKDAFDAVPEDRREAIYDTFECAPDGIKKTINDLSTELNVGDTRQYVDEYGRTQQECCHYDPTDDIIRMEPQYDNEEYAEVFRHEYGHFADSKLGDLSTTDSFVDAINRDMSQFDGENGATMKQTMLDDLAGSSAIDDRCVSDILSGTFNNDPAIMDRYRAEYADYWSHSNDYWSGENGPQYARERETFANLFSVYSAEGRGDSIAFLEKYYPNTAQQFRSFFEKKV